MILYHSVTIYQVLEAIVHRERVHAGEHCVLLLADFSAKKYQDYRQLEAFFDEVLLFSYCSISNDPDTILEDTQNAYRDSVPYGITEFEHIYVASAFYYFSKGWADEVLPAILNGSCFIAVRGREILAFGCAEATAKGFIGPAGTLAEVRRMGISRAIFQRCFRYLIEQGYKYAVGGMAEIPVRNMMKKMADAEPIERSRCSYDDLLVRVRY